MLRGPARFVSRVWLSEVAPAESANVAPSFLNFVTVLLIWHYTFGNLKDRGKCLFRLLQVARTFLSVCPFCKNTPGTDNREFSVHGIQKYVVRSSS